MQINFFPINITFDKYQIYSEEYTDERLIKLREQFNSTHSFFRNNDLIYISNKDGDENSTLGTLVERSVIEDDKVTSSLIKHIFFRTFKDRFANYTPVDFYPFRFFSKQTKDDVIYDILPSDLRDRIAYKKMIELHLRLMRYNGVNQFGFVINIERNWIFNKNCEELKLEGYDLTGIEVLHAEILPGLHNILAPNEELIGDVREIKGEKAIVNTNEGLKELDLKELFIRKTKYNISNYLSFKTSVEKSEEVLNVIEKKRQEIYNAKNIYNEIKSIAKHLFTENGEQILYKNKDSFCFTVNPDLMDLTNTIELKNPTFIFDYAATKTHPSYPDLGLSTFGPYDSINFDIKTPNILCICNRNTRGHFSNFLSSLKNGIPNSKYFQKGLQKKYDLQDVVYHIYEIQNYNLDEYIQIIKHFDESKPHLAIIEIPTDFRKLDDNVNPYYKIKAKLLSLEIPVQFVTTNKIRFYDEYVLNSIALQIYAKLGGTPWVLPSFRSVDREIIIGIGHSWIRQNQFRGANQNRVVGITTFLSSDGQYLLGDKAKDVPFENYFEELLKSLRGSIKRLSLDQGWEEGDTVRLIFHIFKPIKNTEFDVISQLIKEIPEYHIKFAFVMIGKSHPFLLFDQNQKGVKKYGTNNLKGEYIPDRASNIFLDNETCLVQMFGANELKTSLHGMSTPIQIKIRLPQGNYDNNDLNDQLFYDLSYISQQIYSFTYLSWRSFLPAEKPATMLYSTLISKLLSKMRNVDGWDADNLNYNLKRKKWFL